MGRVVAWTGRCAAKIKRIELCGTQRQSVVIHVDRMCKLPISSLDGESSVESSDSHTHTSENNETSVSPCKRRRTQPATDVSNIHTVGTANRFRL